MVPVSKNSKHLKTEDPPGSWQQLPGSWPGSWPELGSCQMAEIRPFFTYRVIIHARILNARILPYIARNPIGSWPKRILAIQQDAGQDPSVWLGSCHLLGYGK